MNVTPVLESYTAYSQCIFHVLSDCSLIESHTVSVYTISQTIAITRGEIFFRSGHILRVFEHIDFMTHRILKYMYELTYQDERLWWYDSMPHPHVQELQSTHPHHKHIPPDIKHHRIPAFGLTFTVPNLPQLISEVEAMVES